MAIEELFELIELAGTKPVILFNDVNRIDDELASNIYSIKIDQATAGVVDVKMLETKLYQTLQDVVERVKVNLAGTKAILYMWYNDTNKSLEWRVISNVGQKKLPFSSDTTPVSLQHIIKDWVEGSRLENEKEEESDINVLMEPSEAELRLIREPPKFIIEVYQIFIE